MNQLQELISKLLEERNLLDKILYKNKNQHEKTCAFSYPKSVLRKLNNFLKMFGTFGEDIYLFLGEFNQPRFTQDEFDSISMIYKKSKDLINLLLQIIEKNLRAVQILSKLISIKLFITLYSCFLSIISRINRFSIEILNDLFEKFFSLTCKIKRIQIIYPKYKSKCQNLIKLSLFENHPQISTLEIVRSILKFDLNIFLEKDITVEQQNISDFSSDALSASTYSSNKELINSSDARFIPQNSVSESQDPVFTFSEFLNDYAENKKLPAERKINQSSHKFRDGKLKKRKSVPISSDNFHFKKSKANRIDLTDEIDSIFGDLG